MPPASPERDESMQLRLGAPANNARVAHHCAVYIIEAGQQKFTSLIADLSLFLCRNDTGQQMLVAYALAKILKPRRAIKPIWEKMVQKIYIKAIVCDYVELFNQSEIALCSAGRKEK